MGSLRPRGGRLDLASAASIGPNVPGAGGFGPQFRRLQQGLASGDGVLTEETRSELQSSLTEIGRGGINAQNLQRLSALEKRFLASREGRDPLARERQKQARVRTLLTDRPGIGGLFGS